MALDSHGFRGSFLQTFLYFLCFPPNFLAPASPHTLSNPLSLRLCICPICLYLWCLFYADWLLLPGDTLDTYKSPLSPISDHFSVLLWVLPLAWLCVWFPGYSTSDPHPRAEELKAFISSWLDSKCFSWNLRMVFRDSLCYTAQLMPLLLQFMVSVFQLLVQGELGDC